jgi:hypothetical protein
MRAFASEVYRLPPHRVIGSVGATEFREQVDRDRHGGRLVGRLPAASLAGGARTRRYPT